MAESRRARRRPLQISLHYDLTRVSEFGAQDPALDILRLAKRIVVINVRPSAERLIAQYRRRESQKIVRLAARAAASADAQSASDVVASLSRRDWHISAYRFPGHVDEVHDRWSRIVAEVAADADLSIIDVRLD
ncbi:MAG: hypothetical protein WD036_07485 [Bauldia sp.]